MFIKKTPIPTIALIALLALTTFLPGTLAFAADNPQTANDQWQVSLNTWDNYEAYNVNNQLYIEARRFLEDSGCIVFWNQTTSQIAVNSRDGDLWVHTVKSAQATLNGNLKDYSSPSVIIDGKTFVSLQMLQDLLRIDSIVEDAEKHGAYLYKTFATTEHNNQVMRILQGAGLDNYNPLNLPTYLQYQKDNPSLSVNEVVLHVNIGVHIPPYSQIVPVENPHSVFAVVDKNHRFDGGFVPNLTWIDGYQWAKEAGDAWLQMKNSARADGIKLSLNNTYRSIASQTANYNNKIASGRSRENVDKTNSRPGHSEHHTGYAADMAGLNSFVGTRAHGWLVENGHKYGFIISFQAGKEFINHYSPEGWHIRWFPVKDAKVMYEQNLTIQEYDNLYLRPRSHGFFTDAAMVQTIVNANN